MTTRYVHRVVNSTDRRGSALLRRLLRRGLLLRGRLARRGRTCSLISAWIVSGHVVFLVCAPCSVTTGRECAVARVGAKRDEARVPRDRTGSIAFDRGFHKQV